MIVKNNTTLCVVPARGGSKGIKNKNLKKINGKSLLQITIEEAKNSQLFDTVHVSTESRKIKKIVEKYPLKVKFLRDKKLSGDHTSLMDVFKFVYNKYLKSNFFFDEVWYLTPCSPLIEAKDLIKACKKFRKSKCNSLLAVGEYSPPIQWAFYKQKNKLIPIEKEKLLLRSQDLRKTYYDSGTFGAFKKEIFLKNKKSKFLGFEINKFKAIDVDTEQDWELLEKIY